MWNAPAVNLSSPQQEVLEQIANSRSKRSDHRQRARLILLFSEGYSNIQAAQHVGLKRRQAGHWRKRWLENQAKLLAIETAQEANPKALMQGLVEVLSDLPRSGASPTFTAEQIAQILTVACEDPQERDLPFSQWSLSVLRDEVIARGIVESISISRLQFFLKSRGFKTAQSGRMDSYAQGSGRIRRASENDM